MYPQTIEIFSPVASDIVSVCQYTTQKRKHENFFHIQVAYFLAKIASVLNVKVKTLSTGTVPINVYAINLAPSGFGKNLTTNTIDKKILGDFRYSFMHSVLPTQIELMCERTAQNRLKYNPNSNFDTILAEVQSEHKNTGKYTYNFDEASQPAIKQMRTNVLMSGCGALNLEIDEFGNNLTKCYDALVAYLELFDIGEIKPKLTKNTKDNIRNEDITGSSPANLLAFGTPSALLNGSDEENLFMSLLEVGFARRCLFGYVDANSVEELGDVNYDPEKHYLELQQTKNTVTVDQLARYYETLADISSIGKVLDTVKDAEIILLHYRNYCQVTANSMRSHEEILKAETQHRYFKVIKLAGAYAFARGSDFVEPDDVNQAIYLVELSGESLNKMLKRDKPHVKLAKFIADIGNEITNVDLIDNLPFYKKATVAVKKELLTLARAWGYTNQLIIKQTIRDGIEFLQGEKLKTTNLNQLIVSYSSSQYASGYITVAAPFDKLNKMVTKEPLFFVNHALEEGKRDNEHVIPGFNLIVLDIDNSTIPYQSASSMLQDIIHFIYTTKSNGIDGTWNYRILIPTNYILKLNEDDFKSFMENIYEHFPFENLDTATKDRPRRWACNANCNYISRDTGKLFDVLPFIPNTSKNEERKEEMIKLSDHDAVTSWFIRDAVKGNRNNALMKYAFMLLDAGVDENRIRSEVLELNSKIDHPIPEERIENTIMVSVSKKLANKP